MPPSLFSRAPFVLLTRPTSSFFHFLSEHMPHRPDYLSNSGKNGMFLLVTSRFLSNLLVILIASLLHFCHVNAVCFNVWLKLSIKDNVLHHVQVLPIVFADCLFEIVYEERRTQFPGFLGAEGGGGDGLVKGGKEVSSQSFGYLTYYQCCTLDGYSR